MAAVNGRRRCREHSVPISSPGEADSAEPAGVEVAGGEEAAAINPSHPGKKPKEVTKMENASSATKRVIWRGNAQRDKWKSVLIVEGKGTMLVIVQVQERKGEILIKMKIQVEILVIILRVK